MKDNEIEVILDYLKDDKWDYFPSDSTPYKVLLMEERDKLLKHMSNSQEELEDLRESDWAWHQLLKVQNKREYRSKFLKEFQKEFGTNTFPDYDEIYKRYDKMKSNKQCVINKIVELQRKLYEEDYVISDSDLDELIKTLDRR